MRLLRQRDYHKTRWKNGGGWTREVFVQRHEGRDAAWDWRVSVAEVEASGPFSAFEGIDRTICLLSGEGMDLGFADGRKVALHRNSEPFRFAGEDSVFCALQNGATTDLNLMSLRAGFRHGMQKIACAGALELAATEGWCMVLVDMPCRLVASGTAFDLDAFDAVVATVPHEVFKFDTHVKGHLFLLNVEYI